jgi:hypothetical protein
LRLGFFDPTPGKRNVIDLFVAKDLKNRREAAAALVRHLRILENSRVATLREQGRLEFVRGDVLSYRFKVPTAGNLWIRLLSAAWPNDNDLIVLHPIIKKRDDLRPADIMHAETNLRILLSR